MQKDGHDGTKTAGRGYSELRPEHRRHGARAPADPRRHAARPVRQPRLLPDVPRLARGDRGPPHLRAGQRPVGHPRPADPARGHRPQELRLRRLRARAHLPGHRPPGDAAQRPQAPGGPPRRAAGPGDGGRDRAAALRGGPEGHRNLRPEHRRHGARAPADPRRHAARPVRQPRLLPDVPRLARGDRGPPHLRAGQRPVGHPRPADPARGHRPQELRLRRLRARAHLPGHRPQGDAARTPASSRRATTASCWSWRWGT